MVHNKTYNNVINRLLRLAELHQQISTTSVGDIWKINLEKMQKFPLLHINPVDVQTGESTLTYNFQIFVMDLVSEKEDWTTNNTNDTFSKLVKDLSNEQDVFNETLQICTDFIGMLRHSIWQSQPIPDNYDINAPVYFAEGEFNIQPFQERFDNLLCGWVFQLSVVVQNDFQTCEIPVLSPVE